MTLDIPGVRPAVLSAQALAALLPVLGFRHFFRRAYAATFEPARLRVVAEDMVRAASLLGADLDRFDCALAQTIAKLT
jgi:hypothetical protein